ncbi:hypothetical protein BDR03DRAFT_965294 [Suillus americanus]|nr:hypothetical protein BDR03DRAFT_965294 [Suillus americanus]
MLAICVHLTHKLSFISACALHRTKLHSSVTFAALVLVRQSPLSLLSSSYIIPPTTPDTS